MLDKVYKKEIAIITFFFLLLFAEAVCPHTSNAKGIDITYRDTWNADNTLIAGVPATYTQIKDIRIDDFTTTDDTASYATQPYLQGLYYYLATTYSEDLPYNYIVGWDGKIYEGDKAGIGSDARSTKGSLYIAYLDNGDGLTDQGSASLSYLLTSLSSKTGIGLDKIIASGYTYSDGIFSDAQPSSSWLSSLDQVKGNLSGQISKTTTLPTYTVAVDSVNTSPNVDGNINVTVSFTNKTNLVLYGRIYAGADTPSPLFVQNIWISNLRSNYTGIQPLENGQNTQVTFEIPSKLAKGNYSLGLYTDNTKINGADFQITEPADNATPTIIPVTPTPQKTITIGPVPTGQLNVHTDSSINAKVIGKVKTGQSFAVIKSTGIWDLISYDGLNTGWVDSQYVK